MGNQIWTERMFLQILNMSMTAAIIIPAVLLVRLCLRRVPKIFSYSLWAVVLFRLLCPFSLSTGFSLLGMLKMPGTQQGSMEYIPREISYMEEPQIVTPVPAVNEALGNSLPAAAPEFSANPMQIYVALGTVVWIIGMSVLLAYGVITLVRLKVRLKGARHEKDNVYVTDQVMMPFVLGIFAPKIYLPSFLKGQEKEYILLHEQIHIKRHDPLIRILGFLALCLHWFNPLVWLAFSISGKDMEMSCDEAVLRKSGSQVKKEYSSSLLTFAAGGHFPNGIPLAFGEGEPGSRIRNVLRYKKPMAAAVGIGAVICGAAAVFLLSNPKETDNGDVSGSNLQTADSQNSKEEKTLKSTVNADVNHDGVEDRICIYISGSTDSKDNTEKSETQEENDNRETRAQAVTIVVYDGVESDSPGNDSKGNDSRGNDSKGNNNAGNGNWEYDGTEYHIMDIFPRSAQEYSSTLLSLIQIDGQDYLLHCFNKLYGGVVEYGYSVACLSAEGSVIYAEEKTEYYQTTLAEEDKPLTVSDFLPASLKNTGTYTLEQIEKRRAQLLEGASILVKAGAEDGQFHYSICPDNGILQPGTQMQADDGMQGYASVAEYCRKCKEEALNQWLLEKRNMDSLWAECSAAWNTVEPLHRQLLELEAGIGNGGNAAWIYLQDEENIQLTHPYIPVANSDYGDEQDILTLINMTCTGNAAKEWKRLLLDSQFYKTVDGNLYQLAADYVVLGYWPNIVDYEKVSEEEWKLSLEADDSDSGARAVWHMTLKWEDDRWKIAEEQYEEE